MGPPIVWFSMMILKDSNAFVQIEEIKTYDMTTHYGGIIFF
jgi:hypothetical protein